MNTDTVRVAITAVLAKLEAKHVMFIVLLTIVIIFAIVVVSATVFAAPGQEIKLIWGLITYQKREPRNEDTKISDNPLELQFKHGVTADAAHDALTRLRLGLRQLQSDEVGRNIGNSPSQTFFFVSSIHLIVSKDSDVDRMLNGGAIKVGERTGVPPNGSSSHSSRFELHHRDNELLLIGYATQSDAELITHLLGEKDHTITLLPHPSENPLCPCSNYTSLILLPISRLQRTTVSPYTDAGGSRTYSLNAIVR